MAEVARDAILTATLLACIFLLAHQSAPVKIVNTPYCFIDRRVVAIDRLGGKHVIWTKGYGLCSDIDQYEQA